VYIFFTADVGDRHVRVTFQAPDFLDYVSYFNLTVFMVPTWGRSPSVLHEYEVGVFRFTGNLYPRNKGLSGRPGEDRVKFITTDKHCKDPDAELAGGSWEVTDLLLDGARLLWTEAYMSFNASGTYQVCYQIVHTQWAPAWMAGTTSNIVVVEKSEPAWFSTQPRQLMIGEMSWIVFQGHDLNTAHHAGDVAKVVFATDPIWSEEYHASHVFRVALCHGELEANTTRVEKVLNGTVVISTFPHVFLEEGFFYICYKLKHGNWITFPQPVYVAPHPPVVQRITGCRDWDVYTFDCRANGTAPITIHGKFFGEIYARVKVGTTWCQHVQHVKDREEEMLICSGYQQLQQHDTKALVTVVSRRGLYSADNLWITVAEIPRVLRVTGCTDNTAQNHTRNCRRANGQVITVQGLHFGREGLTREIRFGDYWGVMCNDVRWFSSEHLECHSYSGEGFDLIVRVKVNGETNRETNVLLSFERYPIVRSV